MYSVLVDFRNRNNLVLIKRLSKNNTNKMTNPKKVEQGESVEGSKYVFKHDYTWTKLSLSSPPAYLLKLQENAIVIDLKVSTFSSTAPALDFLHKNIFLYSMA